MSASCVLRLSSGAAPASIGALDPVAVADGDHERQFWPAVLDRWLY